MIELAYMLTIGPIVACIILWAIVASQFSKGR